LNQHCIFRKEQGTTYLLIWWYSSYPNHFYHSLNQWYESQGKPCPRRLQPLATARTRISRQASEN